ncbi:ATP-binding protein [Streptomyces atratus]|uniref:ATP-binding protein n=1 Tax=Streptomyces atratus TaxID=1893 RepID=UPI00364FCCB3
MLCPDHTTVRAHSRPSPTLGRMSTGDCGTRDPPAIGSPGSAGRERELTALRAALSGPPVVVLIEGLAGIGKSQLVQELVAAQAPARQRVLSTACPAVRQLFHARAGGGRDPTGAGGRRRAFIRSWASGAADAGGE